MGLLRGLGYSNVRHYRGGLADWAAGGGRLERGTTPLVHIEVPAGRRAAPARRPGPREWVGTVVDTIERQSTARLFSAWLAMIFVCAVFYWAAGFSSGHGLQAGGRPVDVSLQGLGTALYFSFVTATSVGYGDVVPLGAIRILAVAEAVAGLLIFGAVVAKFVSRRQDELVHEIHRVTFEERLSRVQSNLHLVLSELQAIAAMSDDGTIRPARVGVRLESAALVFAGELRAIHDLLYRPQWAPEEAVLGAILASLAASLRELTELLARLPSDFGRSDALDGALRGLARLAQEICGECVPRAYAPGLRVWMDRIQETARRIA